MTTGIRPCLVEGCTRDSDAVINGAELHPGTLRRFYEVCPAHYQRMTAMDDWYESFEKEWDSERMRWRQWRVVRFRDGTDGLGSGGFAAL